jgi:hypothetical protein
VQYLDEVYMASSAWAGGSVALLVGLTRVSTPRPNPSHLPSHLEPGTSDRGADRVG